MWGRLQVYKSTITTLTEESMSFFASFPFHDSLWRVNGFLAFPISSNCCKLSQRHSLLRYDCMHANRAERERKGEPTVQYHGKWPFIRFAFVQEPASTIFSFLNVLPHVYFLTFLMRNRFIFTQSKKELPFELWTLLIHASLGALAFSFSVLFHTRDLQWTEALDYTGGFLYASSLFLVIMSFFLKGRDVEGIRSNIFHSILYFAWVAFCAHHLYSLFFVKFDYGYNIQVIAVITILSMSLALVFTWKEWSRPHSWRIALSLLALPPLSLLELFDFPPFLLIFDAHSVWHACTPLVFSLFYTYFTNVVSDLRQAKSK